jgi:hypothetical protein
MKTMKKAIQQHVYVLAALLALASCTKKDLVQPGIPPVPQQPQQPSDTIVKPDIPAAQIITIGLQAVIRVGDLVYDQVPARLDLTTWDSSNKPYVRSIQLEPGKNDLNLDARHIRFQFKLTKWGQTDEMTLERDNIQPGMLYQMGGAAAVKKLKYEITAVWVEGAYRNESKSEYQYGNNGQLTAVKYYQRKKDGAPEHTMTEHLIYTGNKVTEIQKVDVEGGLVENIFFTRDQQGKITAMRKETGGITTSATVHYTPGTNGRVDVRILYRYSHNNRELTYNMMFVNGNLVSGAATNDLHQNELGRYAYDDQINPYVHLNWPDFNFGRSSRNNVNWSQKDYSGAYPVTDPVNLRYTYDAQGYPVSVLKDHKGYNSGQILYTTKTTYHY